ncbi:bifunctional phosphoribosyl-AMP cyclohydrolase/phosphoribosyl-ATP diphosphatase HisIE [Haliovirga abyssi]|uniref:Histidine biosynthesis bifunctional protein HisIE n=1 Tax=Haliovirga abyssi TaxID=2996794 RepID=A0AAU9E4M1_9FUSO|nr:bifunctional phosphoribosyl-AMP cyclohydrolase/phosphoribosyl-ATP diphosphatase HisIE [Haliovirga abyssi]BDU51465.1 histidine biosynthesis bifunctional protein HisIE [Haliovirga abyssi]
MINWEELKFDEKGLIPTIVQDYKDNEVLMMAYMNKESLKLTLETGKATYFSRSRQKLWVKGETSGHIQNVKEMFYDCDGDTLLIKVEQVGNVACHTGNRSCFYRKLKEFEKVEKESVVNALYSLLINRKSNPVEGSYTTYLFEQGLDKILKKVGEESAEVIIGAKNEDKAEVIYEMSDLVYHSLVLLAYFDIKPSEVEEELRKREKK